MDLEALSESLSPELVQAVDALRPIREREEDYHRYLSRMNQLRVQATIEGGAREARELLERAEKALATERRKNKRAEKALFLKDQALEAERREKARAEEALEAERREKARLQALLAKAGILPEG